MMKTIEQAQDLLISLHKREMDNAEHYRTQEQFDAYVQEYCSETGKREEDLTPKELRECAFNFVEYDGGEYLLQN